MGLGRMLMGSIEASSPIEETSLSRTLGRLIRHSREYYQYGISLRHLSAVPPYPSATTP